VVPFYEDQAVIDAARLAMMRHTVFGAPPPPPSQSPGRVTYSQLRVAASYDPIAFRAFWKINGMVCPPDEVYTDPDVIACTQETLRRHGTAPPVAQPAREQLLTALTRQRPSCWLAHPAAPHGNGVTFPTIGFKANWRLPRCEQNVRICAPVVRPGGIYETAPIGGSRAPYPGAAVTARDASWDTAICSVRARPCGHRAGPGAAQGGRIPYQDPPWWPTFLSELVRHEPGEPLYVARPLAECSAPVRDDRRSRRSAA
jgi:hypothetical protein